jgi:phosphoglycerate dehydrogenase-like enzyme
MAGEKLVNEPIHVLSVLHLNERQLAQLRLVSPRLVVQQHFIDVDALGPEAYAQRFVEVLSPDTEILYTHAAPFDLGLTPRLRWVQVDSAGVNLLHTTPLWQSDISITSANGIHAVQIAEYVLSMLLSHFHHLPQAYRLQSQALWAKGKQIDTFVPSEIRGKTLGILGYGAIGREVGRLAAACGMRVIATKRRGSSATFDGWTPTGTGDPDGSIPEQYYDLDELHDLLVQSDVLVLALPLTKQTQSIIGKAELAMVRAHTFIVNIARGPLIDHHALITALQERRIGGVALDVTDPEPLPADSPLWAMENVLITPHIAGLSTHYNDRITDLFSENLRRYLNGEPLLNTVQRALGY